MLVKKKTVRNKECVILEEQENKIEQLQVHLNELENSLY